MGEINKSQYISLEEWKGADLYTYNYAKDNKKLKEVAEYLNVSKDSIYRLAQKREIPASKLGNLWRFRKEEIDDWMKNNRNNKRK